MDNTIILMGMSGIGKSYHAQKLKHIRGYTLFSIDDMIAKELGEGDVHDVASFLGEPYEEKYKENSKKYLELEERFTKEAIEYAKLNKDKKVVIDTTGSVIYLSDELLNELRSFPKTIFLETDNTLIKQMIRHYLLEPKPVIWGELARDFTAENYKEKLTHLYPILLQSRVEKYVSISRIRIPFIKHKEKGFNLIEALG